MRFISQAKRAKWVVRPAYKVMNGPVPEVRPGLTARFYNHVCDTEKLQKEKGWTDEERRQVENHLLSHSDFDKPGGFYLDEIVEGKGSVARPIPAVTKPRCVAFLRAEDGSPEQCVNEALEGEEFCAQHLPAAEDLADEEETAPVAG